MGICVQKISKAFGSFLAVDSVSFEVGKGELVALLGPSGCGKSSLLRAVAGLDPQTAPNAVQAVTVAMASPPRMLPRNL